MWDSTRVTLQAILMGSGLLGSDRVWVESLKLWRVFIHAQEGLVDGEAIAFR
jgi:hypothetical protein